MVPIASVRRANVTIACAFPLGLPNFRIGTPRQSGADAVSGADVSEDESPRQEGAGHS